MDPLIVNINEAIQAEINKHLTSDNKEVSGFIQGLVHAQMLISKVQLEYLNKMSEDMLKETR
jgi:hypothetical protein